jgi:hypothetical protein
MTSKEPTTDLALVDQRTGAIVETAPTALEAAARAEIQSALVLAQRMPRDEERVYAALLRSCRRSSFAARTEYSFKRGRKKTIGADGREEWVDNYVTGPSVILAREAARAWGNIRYGTDVISDADDERTISGWAWDLETNTKVSYTDRFSKLIQRRVGKGAEATTEWVIPDERDLRELTNRRGAILERNAILKLIPADFVEDAINAARRTSASEVESDPDAARKKLVLAFDELNIQADAIAVYLGHPIAQASPAEMVKLRAIWTSIRDGNSTWAEYVKPATDPATGRLSVADVVAGKTTTGSSCPAHGAHDGARCPTCMAEIARATAAPPPTSPPIAPEPTATAPTASTKGDGPTAAVQRSCDRHGAFLGPYCPGCATEEPKKGRRS